MILKYILEKNKYIYKHNIKGEKMKNRLISISILLIFLFTTILSVEAIAPTPRVDLDEYQIESMDINNIYITGTVTIGLGQLIGVYDSSGTFLYNYKQVDNSGDEEDFKIQIPKTYLKEGTNTFKVKSMALKGVINSSNPKTVTVKIKSQTTKKDQTITANNIELYVSETKNLNARASSGLSLTYTSADTNIATVDATGNVVGRKAGTVKITIKQAGNNEYNPVTKSITVTVKEKSTPTTIKKDQTITAKDITLNVGDSKNIEAKSSSGLSLTYKSVNDSIATVDSKGKVVGKKSGKTKITITQAGNNIYNPASKTINVTVTKKEQTITTNFDSYQFYNKGKDYKIKLTAKASSKLTCTYKSSNKKIASIDKKGNITPKKAGTVKITITQKGNEKYKAVTKSVTLKIPNIRSRKSALKPWYNALRTQAKIQNNNYARYDWTSWANGGYTLKGSEYYGTCITFPSASLMRVGLLNDGQYLTPQNGDTWSTPHKNAAIRYMNSHPGYFSYFDHSGTLKAGVDSGKILPGDIIHYSYHTLVFEEKKDGVYYISDAGHNGTSNRNYAIIHHSTSGNAYVGWINRINTYNVYTSCKNGTISTSNQYMAAQNVKVTYKPNKGKKIKSIRLDGKELSKSQIKKYKNSYTFTKLNKNHYITVVFG